MNREFKPGEYVYINVDELFPTSKRVLSCVSSFCSLVEEWPLLVLNRDPNEGGEENPAYRVSFVGPKSGNKDTAKLTEILDSIMDKLAWESEFTPLDSFLLYANEMVLANNVEVVFPKIKSIYTF
jgi:hypothetical protein